MSGQIEVTKNLIINLLKSTERDGIDNLINFMDESGFFVAPASTKFHGAYEGGLAQHSLDVYHAFSELLSVIDNTMDLPEGTQEIACLLHDLCKIGCYYKDVNGYKTVKPRPVGHGVRSVELAEKYIQLTGMERLMIAYHMGVYGLTDFDAQSGEYPLRGGGLAKIWLHYPVCKLIYFADELATLKEKNEQ